MSGQTSLLNYIPLTWNNIILNVGYKFTKNKRFSNYLVLLRTLLILFLMKEFQSCLVN